MSEPALAEPQQMPIPFGVVADTGATRPPLSESDLAVISGSSPQSPDEQAAKRGSADDRHLAVIPTIDASKLAQAGWGVLFPANIDPAVKTALQPLLAHREAQVGNPKRFKIFEGDKGVRTPTQTAVDWLERRGVGLSIVDPRQGVPYYLLLVGTPQQISFEFQFVLDTQWCVGRVYFDTPAEYESYARAVVEYETAATLPHKKDAAMWMTHNAGDAATGLLLNQVGQPFQSEAPGAEEGWTFRCFLDAQATKQQLGDVLTSRPAVLFTGSHGLEWPQADADGQRKNQGALVTQEWMPHSPVNAEQRFGADDLGSTNVQGMFCFLFACFGGGCPSTDTYRNDNEGNPLPLADQPLIARLPQKLLANGALAVMAHVDRAWSWSFQTGSGIPQNQVLRSTIDCIMGGARAGQAADFFNLQWATLAALLGVVQKNRPAATLGNLLIARDDARNYALLGDPAVRLRVEDMQ